jgi:prepilin-type N-terminal cleavage/methylation domain-containing protein
MNERGSTLLELLIALAVGSVVLLGISSLYLATLRFSDQDSSQTFLQRQGVLILEEMARQIRPGTALTQGVCHNNNPNAFGVTNSLGNFCFYQNGTQLSEDRPGGGTENLLGGSPVPLTVSNFVSSLSGIVVTVTFQLQDNDVYHGARTPQLGGAGWRTAQGCGGWAEMSAAASCSAG